MRWKIKFASCLLSAINIRSFRIMMWVSFIHLTLCTDIVVISCVFYRQIISLKSACTYNINWWFFYRFIITNLAYFRNLPWPNWTLIELCFLTCLNAWLFFLLKIRSSLIFYLSYNSSGWVKSSDQVNFFIKKLRWL